MPFSRQGWTSSRGAEKVREMREVGEEAAERERVVVRRVHLWSSGGSFSLQEFC